MRKMTLIILLFIIGCTSSNDTTRTLVSSGYSDVKIDGYAPWSCGKDDLYATKFTARNPVGNIVSGVVCCGGIFKGCTIRF